MTTKYMIEVMQAYEEGAAIEARSVSWPEEGAVYADAENPSWNWNFYDYRVKPVKLSPVYAIYNADKTLFQYSEHARVIYDIANTTNKEVVVLTPQSI